VSKPLDQHLILLFLQNQEDIVFYEERKSNVFKSGETFLLYVEPLGYTYGTVTDEDDNTLYTMNFTLDFIISYKNGNVLGGQQDLPVNNIVSYHQNKELNLDISIEQSSPFPPVTML
jgi:hypothetical protein